ncbi:MAG TPA: TetR family transcriptional regulator [Egibacteraceae bacterium]|nr:TetR family transcriptional regulator [Egibacteraceae bacterium]
MARTGRRPGDSGTRGAILDAARRSFAEDGYEASTMRSIAGRAGVDPALLYHYFGSKEQLFVTAMQLPFSPSELIPTVVEGGRERLGERIVRLFLAIWDRGDGLSPFLALLRSASANERAAAMLREFISREVIGQLARTLGLPQAELRATLVGSQVAGLAVVRYILRVEPLASADHDTVVACVAPTVQRYLTEDLGLGPVP